METGKVAVAALAVLVFAGSAQARAVKKADLTRGYEEGSVVSRPVLDTSGLAPLEIGDFREAFDKSEPVFRRKKSAWVGGGAKLTIDETLDLGALFADALRAEAPKMGFSTGPGGWKLGGEIREIYFDNATPSAWSIGVLLFYTSMTVRLELVSPAGERFERTQRLLGYFVAGGKFVPTALARQMVFAAQDALARLNATDFRAPSHPGVGKMIEELRARPMTEAKDLVRMVGLSGSREAVGPLLEKLGAEKDEGDRTFLVEALAALGSPEALAPLAARYAGEDEDNRLATLKVYEYVGTPEARRLAGEASEKDPDAYLKRLAREVADGASVRGPLPEK